MANKYLLTGAGFSKSFGALLCKELTAKFFNRLISKEEIQNFILEKQNLGNFEQILSEVQCSHPGELEAIKKILKDVFVEMVKTIKTHHEIPGESRFTENQPYEFLDKFDYIFTLNQDSLLKDLGNGVDKNFSAQRNLPIAGEKAGNNTPYLELHGAYDWENEDGSLMIFGTSEDKVKYIDSNPLFKKYFEFFKELLNKPNSKLVIIGYSFCDPHVNDIINIAIKSGLKIFIWDPKVLKLIDGLKPSIDEGFFISYDDMFDSEFIANLKKSLRGYLGSSFSLIGDDKNYIYRFLEA